MIETRWCVKRGVRSWHYFETGPDKKCVGVEWVAAFSLILCPGIGMAEGEKPKVLKPCLQCHADGGDNDIRSKFGSASMKAETLRVDTGDGVSWLINFDEDTTLEPAHRLFHKSLAAMMSQ